MSVKRVYEICQRLLDDWPEDPEQVAGFHAWFETLHEVTQQTHLAGVVVWLESALVVTSRPGCMDEDTAVAIRMSLERLVRMLAESHPELVEGDDPDRGVRKMNDMLLGEILCQLGFIEPETAGRALREQGKSGRRFGETLIEMGEIGPEDLDVALSLQRVLQHGPEDEKLGVHAGGERSGQGATAQSRSLGFLQEMLLGEILVRFGKLRRQDLEKALEVHRKGTKHLGQVLVEMGTATEADIADALFVQSEMREAQRP